MSKDHLRRIRGKALPPKKPEPESEVSGNPGLIFMPIKPGHPDTEICFTQEGQVVATLRLRDFQMSSNAGSTATFESMDALVNRNFPAPSLPRSVVSVDPAGGHPVLGRGADGTIIFEFEEPDQVVLPTFKAARGGLMGLGKKPPPEEDDGW